MVSRSSVFLTGATGFLGSRILKCLTQLPVTRIYCLIRGQRGRQSAQERLSSILAKMQIENADDRVVAVDGDIRNGTFGLSDEDYQNLAAKVDYVVHCAASVNFLSTRASLEHINVNGTKNVTGFVQACIASGAHFQRFVYVSTAYVNSTRKGLVEEKTYSDPVAFNNEYERSKWLGEQHVASVLPATCYVIVRPSIIVGDSGSGAADKTNVIFEPIRLMTDVKLPLVVFADANASLDIVAVDDVAHYIIEILSSSHLDRNVVHAAAGHQNRLPIKTFLQTAGSIFNFKFLILPPWLYKLIWRPFLKLRNRKDDLKEIRVSDAYLPYLWCSPQFDVSGRTAIGHAGPTGQNSTRLLAKCLDYAKATNFGDQA